VGDAASTLIYQGKLTVCVNYEFVCLFVCLKIAEFRKRSQIVETVVEILAEDKKEDKHDKRSILEEQYLPNIIVSHDLNSGSPVIYEPNPRV
jgi:hypothetical protein